MATNVNIFEARILIKSERPVRYHSWKDGEEYKKTIKMLHIERRTHKQALNIAKNYADKNNGEVLSCHKVDRWALAGNMESLPIRNDLYVNRSQYPNAIAMDEMIWKRKDKRRKKKLEHKNNGEGVDK